MTMKPEFDKYNKLMTLLRNSKPELDSTEEIEREVMRRIKGVKESGSNLSTAIEFLFGWVYIS